MKNDLILRALKGEKTERIPVWMMRQAGRTLPEYKKVRSSISGFKGLVQHPEKAAEVTIQPVDRYGVDAAILFSDILVIPEALGFDYEVKEGIGPIFEETLFTKKLQDWKGDISDVLSYVGEGIKHTNKGLDGRCPLLGFAGAPFTIFCYLAEGGGSKTFSKAKRMMQESPAIVHHALEQIAICTAQYLDFKVKSGVHAVQLFDSWAGILNQSMYAEFSLPYIKMVLDLMESDVPKIVFAKGAWFSLEDISKLNCSALGIDWHMSPEFARANSNGKVLQGNLDPTILYASESKIEAETKKMLRAFGTQGYIANLGHGIYPDVDFNKAQVFVDVVKNFDI
jgi:uroporphyrinogen decarboxylase